MQKFEFAACLRYAKLMDKYVKKHTNKIVYSCMHRNGDMTIDLAGAHQQENYDKIANIVPMFWKIIIIPREAHTTTTIVFFKYIGGLIETQT